MSILDLLIEAGIILVVTIGIMALLVFIGVQIVSFGMDKLIDRRISKNRPKDYKPF